MNKTLKDATLKMFQYDNIQQFKESLNHFLNYYNCSKKLSAIGRKSPYDFIKEKYKINLKMFTKNPLHHCLGLNIYVYTKLKILIYNYTQYIHSEIERILDQNNIQKSAKVIYENILNKNIDFNN